MWPGCYSQECHRLVPGAGWNSAGLSGARFHPCRRPFRKDAVSAESKIKFRGVFSPVCPQCPARKANEYFDLDALSPICLTAPVKEGIRRRMTLVGYSGIQKSMSSAQASAVTHGLFRASQTVDRGRFSLYYALINAFISRPDARNCKYLL